MHIEALFQDVSPYQLLSLLEDIFQDPGESTSTLGGCCLLRLFVG